MIAQPTVPLQWFTSALHAGVSIQCVRYGDGEWISLTDLPTKRYGQADRHQYFPEMGNDLRATLTDPILSPHYMHVACTLEGVGFAEWCASNNNVQKPIWTEAASFVRDHCPKDLVFYKQHPINIAFFNGALWPFIKELRNYEIMYVGPERLRALHPEFLNIAHFVEIPSHDCYLEKDRVLHDIEMLRDRVNFIGFSCAMTANILIHSLCKRGGPVPTMIDFGSVFESCVGVNTRGKDPAKLQDIIKANFGLK
jgi:hypothetical protein